MFEADAPSTLRALAEMRIAVVRQKIDEVATALGGFEGGDPDDLVAEALLGVCDPQGSPWDPERGSLVRHMGQVMRDLRLGLADDATRVLHRRLGLELRQSLMVDDPIALDVFDAVSAGIELMSVIAVAVGVPVSEVTKAQRRFVYRAARIREKHEAADARARAMGAPAGSRRPRHNQDRS
jgi:hypothetical protein